MHAEVITHLRCPLCHEPLHRAAASLRCPLGHNFDEARQGYLRLAAGALSHAGDTSAMVAARAAFLGARHFAAITTALTDAAVAGWPGDLVLDVGGGTGAYLAGVLDALPAAWGLVIDASKPAARLAARAHPRMDAVVCDAWAALPLADRSVGVLLNVFAPRNPAAFARVLRQDGVLLVVTPTAGHLAELVGPLDLLRVDPDKPARLGDALSTAFVRDTVAEVCHPMTLAHGEVAALVGMGPSAHHQDPATTAARIAALPERVTVTASITISAYRPRQVDRSTSSQPTGPS